MDKKIVGIVGGLGPETTSEFYLDLIKKFRDDSDYYPSIVINNVSFPFYLEKEIILNSQNEEKILPFILDSISSLNDAGVDFIIIPCNTVHIFIKEFRSHSDVPVVNIIEECIKEIKSKNLKKIGILATTKTIDSGMYQNEIENNNINFIIPNSKNQNRISKSIINILNGDKNYDDLHDIINNFIDNGCDSILLGCTDLQLIISDKTYNIEVLDSMKILSNRTFEILKG